MSVSTGEGAALDVTPDDFRAAASAIGDTVATLARFGWESLLADLGPSNGMAGDDPAGQAWGSSYDTAAAQLSQAATDLVNCCTNVGSLLDQTGLNYERAEHGSILGMGDPISARARFASDWIDDLGTPPDAVGYGLIELPSGWALVQHAIRRMWPNGHQDRLRAAALAWRRLSGRLTDLDTEFDSARLLALAQLAPESDSVVTVINDLAAQLGEVAGSCDDLGDTCDGYAHALDSAHHQIIAELESFLEWTAGIEIGGALFSFFSLGASEAVAQGIEAIKMTACGERIAELIDALITAARGIALAVDSAATRVTAAIAKLGPIMARRARVIWAARAEDIGAIQVGRPLASQVIVPDVTAVAKALQEMADGARVGPASETWGNLRTLAGHVRDHGKDFGIYDDEDYARFAAEFRLRAIREKYPCKLDATKGDMKFYDPKTNTFAVYRLDGRTRSIYKPPGRMAYWKRQDGVLIP